MQWLLKQNNSKLFTETSTDRQRDWWVSRQCWPQAIRSYSWKCHDSFNINWAESEEIHQNTCSRIRIETIQLAHNTEERSTHSFVQDPMPPSNKSSKTERVSSLIVSIMDSMLAAYGHRPGPFSPGWFSEQTKLAILKYGKTRNDHCIPRNWSFGLQYPTLFSYEKLSLLNRTLQFWNNFLPHYKCWRINLALHGSCKMGLDHTVHQRYLPFWRNTCHCFELFNIWWKNYWVASILTRSCTLRLHLWDTL